MNLFVAIILKIFILQSYSPEPPKFMMLINIKADNDQLLKLLLMTNAHDITPADESHSGL